MGTIQRLSGTKKAPVSENQETGAIRLLLICWWTRQESNLEPAGYEPEALPIELRVRRRNLLCPVPVFCQDNFFERKTRLSPEITSNKPGFLYVTPKVERSAQSFLLVQGHELFSRLYRQSTMHPRHSTLCLQQSFLRQVALSQISSCVMPSVNTTFEV